MLTHLEQISLIDHYKRTFQYDKSLEQLVYVYNHLPEDNYYCTIIYDNLWDLIKEKYGVIDRSWEIEGKILEGLNHQRWLEKHGYDLLYDKCNKILSKNLKKDFDNTYELEKDGLDIRSIISKKIKMYNWNSIFTFGNFQNKSLLDIFIINPNIIKDYHTNLSHFLLSSRVILSTKFYTQFKDEIWDLLEKHIIKWHLYKIQSEAINYMNEFEKHLKKQTKLSNQIYEDAYWDYFENDPSNLWNID